jgi:hypothetical protein
MRADRASEIRFRLTAPMAAAMLAASVWLVGCSRPDVRSCRIHGVVTVDGRPAREGVIRFEIVSAGDLPSGATIVDGVYEAWVTPGRKVVRIVVAGSRDGLTERDLTPNIVPKKYDQSPTQIDVQKSGVFDFPLVSDEAVIGLPQP